MFNLDPGKLLIIGVVAVLLLGPDRLPQVARQAGGAWRTFNDFRHRMETEVRSSIPDLPSTTDIARLARSPSALLDHLSTMGNDAGTPNGTGTRTTDADIPDGAPIESSSAHAGNTDSAGTVTGDGPAEPSTPHATEVVLPGDPSLN